MRPTSMHKPKRSCVCGCGTSRFGQRAHPAFARRGLLAAAGIAVLSFNSGLCAPAHAGQKAGEKILQPPTLDETAFMHQAFEMRQAAIAKGDQAYGAVIVRDDIIVGQSWSRVILDNDPTGHAEMSAIRDAARRLYNRDLSGAIMYSTSQPCPMCEAAAYWAGIGQLVYGRGLTNGGRPKLCG